MSHQTDIDDCPRFVTPSAEELVRFMRDEKGISFELVSEEDAERFLDEKNFFFKVKAFAKNYPKYEKGERAGHYIGLDFGHHVELSRWTKRCTHSFLIGRSAGMCNRRRLKTIARSQVIRLYLSHCERRQRL